jgi:hypothetical protein
MERVMRYEVATADLSSLREYSDVEGLTPGSVRLLNRKSQPSWHWASYWPPLMFELGQPPMTIAGPAST